MLQKVSIVSVLFLAGCSNCPQATSGGGWRASQCCAYYSANELGLWECLEDELVASQAEMGPCFEACCDLDPNTRECDYIGAGLNAIEAAACDQIWNGEHVSADVRECMDDDDYAAGYGIICLFPEYDVEREPAENITGSECYTDCTKFVAEIYAQGGLKGSGYFGGLAGACPVGSCDLTCSNTYTVRIDGADKTLKEAAELVLGSSYCTYDSASGCITGIDTNKVKCSTLAGCESGVRYDGSGNCVECS